MLPAVPSRSRSRRRRPRTMVYVVARGCGGVVGVFSSARKAVAQAMDYAGRSSPAEEERMRREIFGTGIAVAQAGAEDDPEVWVEVFFLDGGRHYGSRRI